MRLRELGRRRSVRFISCSGLTRNKILMSQFRKMMNIIQTEYGSAVDIEFTINLSETGEYTINLLQCRPLKVFKDTGKVAVPGGMPEENKILESIGATMGLSRSVEIDTVVYIDPVAYYNMPYQDKPDAAKLLGQINWTLRDRNRHMLLMVPGRIGTSSPELGVPAGFADISGFEAICEIQEKNAGYNPELSYGSHIFQDLVESEILYSAVFSDEKTLVYSPDRLSRFPNITGDFTGNDMLRSVVKVYDTSGSGLTLYNDLNSNHLLLAY